MNACGNIGVLYFAGLLPLGTVHALTTAACNQMKKAASFSTEWIEDKICFRIKSFAPTGGVHCTLLGAHNLGMRSLYFSQGEHYTSICM